MPRPPRNSSRTVLPGSLLARAPRKQDPLGHPDHHHNTRSHNLPCDKRSPSRPLSSSARKELARSIQASPLSRKRYSLLKSIPCCPPKNVLGVPCGNGFYRIIAPVPAITCLSPSEGKDEEPPSDDYGHTLAYHECQNAPPPPDGPSSPTGFPPVPGLLTRPTRTPPSKPAIYFSLS